MTTATSPMVDRIRAAVAAVDADPGAGTRKQSHTIQTRRVAAALRAIGLSRTEFRARVTYERDGGGRVYGDAIGTPTRAEGARLVEENAQALVDAGFRVFLIGSHSHFISTGSYPGVHDYRTDPSTSR